MTHILAANIGAKALYLLFAWLLSAIIASWLSGRAGYGEKSGLASGLILTFVAIPIWLIIYLAIPRDGSARAIEGIVPVRKKADALDLKTEFQAEETGGS